MGKVVFMFPGQGSQTTGMGKDFYDNFSVAKNVFDLADDVLGRKISDLCFCGSDDELKQTTNSQPAILTTSIACLEVFKQHIDLEPDYVLGHSLGEIASYYTAGVFSLEDAFKVIQKRADFMQEVTQQTQGTMSAVIGADISLINDCIRKVGNGVGIANYNTPAQIVLTGEKEAVLKVGNLLKENGVRKVIPLAVSGAFHSPLMITASKNFETFLKNIQFNNANIPVITNVDACETTMADDFRKKIVEQIYSSVKWTDSIKNLIELGADTFIEFGAGHVLTGLVSKIDNSVKTYNVSDCSSLQSVLDNLKIKEKC